MLIRYFTVPVENNKPEYKGQVRNGHEENRMRPDRSHLKMHCLWYTETNLGENLREKGAYAIRQDLVSHLHPGPQPQTKHNIFKRNILEVK
jgi:hypothetical protein